MATSEQRNFQYANLRAFKVGHLIDEAYNEAEKALATYERLDEKGFKFPIQRRTLTKKLKVLDETLVALNKAYITHKKGDFKRVSLTRSRSRR